MGVTAGDSFLPNVSNGDNDEEKVSNYLVNLGTYRWSGAGILMHIKLIYCRIFATGSTIAAVKTKVFGNLKSIFDVAETSLRPSDAAVQPGECVELLCRLGDSANIVWLFAPWQGNQAPRNLVIACTLQSGMDVRYGLNTTGGQCSLIISNVTEAQMGYYTCQNMDEPLRSGSAQLALKCESAFDES